MFYSRCRCSQLYVVLTFTLILMKVDGGQKCNKPPSVCIVLPADINNGVNHSQTADLIQQSVISKTPNQTVAVGDNATFEIIVDLSDIDDTLSDLSIAPFVGGCEVIGGKSPHCLSPKKRGSKLIQTCTFRDVSLKDDGRNIQYWIVLFFEEKSLYVCQSPSYLTVEADPEPVEAVDYTVNPCSGINFTFSTPSVNDTNIHIECTIYYDYYHNTNVSVPVYSSTDCTNDTLVPPEVFVDHSGNYSLVSQSVKTVARGEKKIFSFSLGSDYLQLEIKKISIEVKNNKFYGEISAKVNSCLLLNPNFIFIQSNCSDHEQIEKIPENPESDDRLVFFHGPLQKEKRFCNFTIYYSVGGNTTYYQTNISTFFLQEVLIQEHPNDPRYLTIVCRFVSAGSVVVGCTLNVTSEYTSPLIYNITTRDPSSLVCLGVVGPLVPGTTYTIGVNEFVGEPVNTSGTLFEIIKVAVPSVKGSVSPTTTQYYSVVTDVAAAKPSNNNKVAVGTGIAIGAVMILTIAALVITVIALGCKLHNKNNRQRYDVHKTRDIEMTRADPPSSTTTATEESSNVKPTSAQSKSSGNSHQSTAETNEASTLVYSTSHPPNVTDTVDQPGELVHTIFVPSRVPAGDSEAHRDSITQIFTPAEGVQQQQKPENETSKYVPPGTQNDGNNASGSTTNRGEDAPLLKKKKRH